MWWQQWLVIHALMTIMATVTIVTRSSVSSHLNVNVFLQYFATTTTVKTPGRDSLYIHVTNFGQVDTFQFVQVFPTTSTTRSPTLIKPRNIKEFGFFPNHLFSFLLTLLSATAASSRKICGARVMVEVYPYTLLAKWFACIVSLLLTLLFHRCPISGNLSFIKKKTKNE